MPEITSVERVSAKLREFDERMEGAITAAKTLNRVRDDAEKLLEKIQGFTQKSEHAQQKAESVRLQMEQLQQEWEGLKRQIEESRNESTEVRDLLLSEYDSVIQSLNRKLVEAEERLITTNREALIEQAELLKRLEGSTRVNAESVSEAKSLVLEQAEKLKHLLASVRDDLQNNIRAKLHHFQEMLDFQFETTERQLEDKIQTSFQKLDEEFQNNSQVMSEAFTTFKNTIWEQIKTFQDEMNQLHSEHQQSVDRQVTNFLNRQNVLVQNLTQQIDSYQRSAQTLSSELHMTKTQLNKLQSLVDSIQHKQVSQSQELSRVDSFVKEVVQKLMSLPVIGSKFKAGG